VNKKSGHGVLISACLLGLKCNYRRQDSPRWEADFKKIIEPVLKAGFFFVPVCPEQLGGLPTPRHPSELTKNASEILAAKGRVVTREMQDVTDFFINGAKETLLIAQRLSLKLAVLKEKSPSCGSKVIHSGSFEGKLTPGEGITSYLLRINNIKIFNDEDFIEIFKSRDWRNILRQLLRPC